MFCDLVGSTALSARLDPEDMQRVITSYHTCIGEVVGRFQGMIARYMGDGVLAYFGYPRAQEDDVEQAVRAALALVEAVTNLRTDADAVLQARVSVATGTVIVSELLIDHAPAEQSVVGETPNLAARLQTLAEPGTVLICRIRAGHGWALRLSLSRCSRAQRLGGACAGLAGAGNQRCGERLRGYAQKHAAAAVRAEEEIELLLRRWRHATLEEGRVVVLTGEPGIGKSHIARALDQRLHGEPTLHCAISARHIIPTVLCSHSLASSNGLPGLSAATRLRRGCPSLTISSRNPQRTRNRWRFWPTFSHCRTPTSTD